MIRNHVLFVLRVLVALIGIIVCLVIIPLGTLNAFLRVIHEELKDE